MKRLVRFNISVAMAKLIWAGDYQSGDKSPHSKFVRR